jgi:hypothetical protein
MVHTRGEHYIVWMCRVFRILFYFLALAVARIQDRRVHKPSKQPLALDERLVPRIVANKPK